MACSEEKEMFSLCTLWELIAQLLTSQEDSFVGNQSDGLGLLHLQV